LYPIFLPPLRRLDGNVQPLSTCRVSKSLTAHPSLRPISNSNIPFLAGYCRISLIAAPVSLRCKADYCTAQWFGEHVARADIFCITC
jgi:hypothetical protein